MMPSDVNGDEDDKNDKYLELANPTLIRQELEEPLALDNEEDDTFRCFEQRQSMTPLGAFISLVSDIEVLISLFMRMFSWLSIPLHMHSRALCNQEQVIMACI